MNNVSHPDGTERSDAEPRLIAGLALGLALFLLITPALLAAIYPRARSDRGIPRDLPQPPAPRLQVEPAADLARLRATEEARLNGYGWAGDKSQIAHIPISRAIELIGQRGLPGWPYPPSR